jgi:hypothetical protein
MTKNDNEFYIGVVWLYRSSIDRRFWHQWENGVHTVWDWITDDYGNLVRV